MHKANGFTRHEILTTIKMQGSMTADELGQTLGISPVAVRQHLAALEAEGVVTTSIERRHVGRPVHRYTITELGDETFPRTYDDLTNDLLGELLFLQGEGEVEALLTARRKRLQATNEMRMENKSLAGRACELARMQTEAGYMAEVEDEKSGFMLVEHNCPVCRVARHYPSLCAQELTLFRELLGDRAVIEREKHMMAGDHVCAYRIREAETK